MTPRAPKAPVPGTALTTDVAPVYPEAEMVALEEAALALAVAEEIPKHALDLAPIGSKLVGTEQGTVLATPDGEVLLPREDIAGKLPAGARIQKIGEGAYRSVQLNPAEDHAALVTATAVEAIQQFRSHFHGD